MNKVDENLKRESKNILLVTLVVNLVILLITNFSTQELRVNKVIESDNNGYTSLLQFIICVLFILTLWFLLSKIFRNKLERLNRLVFILLGYILVIITFASFYYSISVVLDVEDSSIKYQYYTEIYNDIPLENSNQQNKQIDDQKENVINYINSIEPIEDSYSFRGTKNRIWTSIDHLPEDFVKGLQSSKTKINDKYSYIHDREFSINQKYSINSVKQIIYVIDVYSSNSKINDSEITSIIGQPTSIQERVDAYLEYIYFSTATISTLGYGDIVPNNSLSRLLVVLEILIGQIILVFGVGVTFDIFNFNEESEQKKS